MKKIVFDNLHRRKHFDFFRQMDQPHFGVTTVIDINPFLQYIEDRGWPFTPTTVFAISYTLNEIPEFRYRIRGEEVIEHELIHPSFTVTTAVSDVFSFCTVPFSFNATDFIDLALTKIEEMQHQPSFEDEKGRDDFIFMSAMPWISFTSVMHPMHYHPVDSVPRVAWGRYEKKEDKVIMPVALQAHHAVVDGVHMGRFFQLLEKKMQHPRLFFEEK
jgi:chloramphenicol O-acetyltransferase type A